MLYSFNKNGFNCRFAKHIRLDMTQFLEIWKIKRNNNKSMYAEQYCFLFFYRKPRQQEEVDRWIASSKFKFHSKQKKYTSRVVVYLWRRTIHPKRRFKEFLWRASFPSRKNQNIFLLVPKIVLRALSNSKRARQRDVLFFSPLKWKQNLTLYKTIMRLL